jgi:hypothetical protein
VDGGARPPLARRKPRARQLPAGPQVRWLGLHLPGILRRPQHGHDGGSTWVEPRFTCPTARPSRNVVLIAEGYFTGRRVTRDLRDGAGEPEEWIYKLWEFRVTRVRLLPEGHEVYDEDSPLNRVRIFKSKR